ncbi:hypothetical protein MHH37_08820 [Solibacillus sp. FSL K6-1781]|uniref:hypothetical protein n=1 Tax=Solibacillus sp. FSL K6-1781 TaxID=2921474 RepID=UPI00315A95F4
MKKYILSFLIVILIATTVIIFLNVNKSRNLEIHIFDTDNLSEEINQISVVDNSTTIGKSIKKDNPLFLPLITLLTDMEFRKSNLKFSYSEGYDLLTNHNGNFYSIQINENGLFNIDGKVYKIQNNETVNELFNILKKSTQ